MGRGKPFGLVLWEELCRVADDDADDDDFVKADDDRGGEAFDGKPLFEEEYVGRKSLRGS